MFYFLFYFIFRSGNQFNVLTSFWSWPITPPQKDTRMVDAENKKACFHIWCLLSNIVVWLLIVVNIATVGTLTLNWLVDVCNVIDAEEKQRWWRGQRRATRASYNWSWSFITTFISCLYTKQTALTYCVCLVVFCNLPECLVYRQ